MDIGERVVVEVNHGHGLTSFQTGTVQTICETVDDRIFLVKLDSGFEVWKKQVFSAAIDWPVVA